VDPGLDYWAPLGPGSVDPCYEPSDPWCNVISPKDSWFCSRTPGHPGPHVASDVDQVLEVWDGLPMELRLPEGF
jgi:hypothetical protein